MSAENDNLENENFDNDNNEIDGSTVSYDSNLDQTVTVTFSPIETDTTPLVSTISATDQTTIEPPVSMTTPAKGIDLK